LLLIGEYPGIVWRRPGLIAHHAVVAEEYLFLEVGMQRFLAVMLRRAPLHFSRFWVLVYRKMEQLGEELYTCTDRSHHRPVPKELASSLVADEEVQLLAYLPTAVKSVGVGMAMAGELLEVQMLEVKGVVQM
jgi:hypothetical protein